MDKIYIWIGKVVVSTVMIGIAMNATEKAGKLVEENINLYRKVKEYKEVKKEQEA